MFPMDKYNMIRNHQQDLLQQAEHERLIQEVKHQQHGTKFQHKLANWLGMKMVRWGQSLERVGTLETVQRASSASTASQKLNIQPYHRA